MKIAIVSPFNPKSVADFLFEKDAATVPLLYNASTSITSIVRGLIEIGHKVIIFTLSELEYKDQGTQWFYGKNINICIVNRYKPMKGFGRFGRLLYGRILSKEIKKYIADIDVLHAHWTYEYADACLPFVDTLPVLCTIDDWQPYIKTIYNKSFSQWFFWTIVSGIVFRKVMRSYPKIHLVANSKYTQRCLKEYFNGKDFSMLPNSIPHEFILDKRDEYPVSPIILSICQVIADPRKNIATLVEAFHFYKCKKKDAQLWLVGDYDERDALVKDWSQKGWLDGVRFLGKVSHKDIWTILDKVSLLVHPSFEETFGGILLEAMSRRVPVIGGAQSGAVPYVLENGEVGVLCDISSAESIFNAISFVMESPIYRNALISKATKLLLEKYSNIVNAHIQVDMYNKYLKHNSLCRR